MTESVVTFGGPDQPGLSSDAAPMVPAHQLSRRGSGVRPTKADEGRRKPTKFRRLSSWNEGPFSALPEAVEEEANGETDFLVPARENSSVPVGIAVSSPETPALRLDTIDFLL
jgi:hypothetical protein